MFAQQGYFVVAINPTGSTTFGQGTSLPPSSSFVTGLLRLVSRPHGRNQRRLGRKAVCRSPQGVAIYPRQLPSGLDACFSSAFACLAGSHRSIRTVPSPLARVTEDMQSSMSFHGSIGTVTRDAFSWIQSNPDFGFGFKALVCHDGVGTNNLPIRGLANGATRYLTRSIMDTPPTNSSS